MLNWNSCSVWNDALLWYKSAPIGSPTPLEKTNLTSISLALKETPIPDISNVYVELFSKPLPIDICNVCVSLTPFNSPTTVPPSLKTLTL